MYTEQVSKEIITDIDDDQMLAIMASKISIIESCMTNKLDKIDTVMEQMKLFMDKIISKYNSTSPPYDAGMSP